MPEFLKLTCIETNDEASGSPLLVRADQIKAVAKDKGGHGTRIHLIAPHNDLIYFRVQETVEEVGEQIRLANRRINRA